MNLPRNRFFYPVFSGLLLLLFSACYQATQDEANSGAGPVLLKAGGSVTMAPIVAHTRELFQRKFPNIALRYEAVGSNAGIELLEKGENDLALVSRDLTADERALLEKDGRELQVNIVAYDGLSIIVNIKNKVTAITREQLAAIWSGQITNWKTLGGDDRPIIVLGRDKSSGTHEYFRQAVLDTLTASPSVTALPDNQSIIKTVIEREGAISYVGLGYVQPEIKSLALSFDGGKNYVEDNWNNLRNNKYPLTRPLYYAFYLGNKARVWPYIDLLLSEEGQQLIWESGYLPIDRH